MMPTPLFQFDAFNGPAPAPGLIPAPADRPEPPPRKEVERALLSSGPAVGYRPTLPGAYFSDSNDTPNLSLFYRDLPSMLMHPRVKLALNYYRSGVSNAEFRVTASSPAVQQFVEKELHRFWESSLDQITGMDHDGAGYGWGWVGCQVRYTIREGLLSCERVEGFEPRDTVPLLDARGRYLGFRVKRVYGSDRGHADLWGPGCGPAKGFWYCHRPKKGRHYGLSVCYPAWRSWSRLARRNGAENNLDLGMYKYAVQPAVVRHPDNTQQAVRQANGPAEQSDGDKALELAEGIKSGAAIAMKNTRDAKGEYAWSYEPPPPGLDPTPLITNIEHLEGEIDAGIGVPSELMEAAETGSGYSGRQIPLEGYFQAQQSNATSLVRQWKEQIGGPLVAWNFGAGTWFDVEVLPLLQTRMESNRPPQSPGGSPTADQDGSPRPSDPGGPGRPGQPPRPQPPGGPQPPKLPPLVTLATGQPRDEMGQFVGAEGEGAGEAAAGDAIQDAAAAAAKALSAAARTELVAVLVGPADAGVKLDRARGVLSRYREDFTRQLFGARLAGMLAGMRNVAELLPDVLSEATAEQPADAATTALAAAVAGLEPAQRATALAAIAGDVRLRVERVLRTSGAAALPPADDTPWTVNAGDEGGAVTLPFIDEAVQDLRGRRVLTRELYDLLTAQARSEAFTVAGLEETSALEAVQDALATTIETGGGRRTFERRVEEALGEGTFLSDSHAEVVYRANVMSALSNGQAAVLAHPMVGDLFPFAFIHATLDNRTRPWHAALETAGIDHTNVYARSDPTFETVRGPADFNCRCTWTPATVQQAAAAGVQVAREWLASGQAPESLPHVPLPPGWRQSPGWVRMAADDPEFEKKHPRDEAGRFTEIGRERLEKMSVAQLGRVFTNQGRQSYVENLMPKRKPELIESILNFWDRQRPANAREANRSTWGTRDRNIDKQNERIAARRDELAGRVSDESLRDIPVGELHTVGGFKVRRTGGDEWRVEKQGGKGHVTGDAKTVRAHIERETSNQKAYGKQRREALSRAEAHDEPNWTDSGRIDAAAAAFAKLPKGAAVVSLEPDTYGRTGRIVKDETGANRVQLDGEDGYASNHVEPMEAKHSWRVPKEAEAPKMKQATLFATTAAGKGRWITIGGHKGGDGKRHGGSPVYIVNGVITKGHPRLTGKKVAALDDEGEATGHRKEQNQSKDYARAKAAKQARKEGIDPAHLHQLAAQLVAHDKEFTADRRQMLADARKSLAAIGGHGKALHLIAGRGKDAASIKGLDEVAEDLAKRYPSAFSEHEHASDTLFSLLTEGAPEPLAESDAYEQALDHLREHKHEQRKRKEEEDFIPFSTGEPDAAGHEHKGKGAGGGQFTGGPGGGGEAGGEGGGAKQPSRLDRLRAARDQYHAARKEHYGAAKQEAAQHRAAEVEAQQSLRHLSDNTVAIADSSDKATAAYGEVWNGLDEALGEYDENDSLGNRFASFGAMRAAAAESLKKLAGVKPGAGDDRMTQEEIDEAKANLTGVVQHAQAARQAIRKQLAVRQEMSKIRRGDV
jgi:hypothetical protein